MKPEPITIDDWLKAEHECKKYLAEPQPKGSITVEQYAAQTNRSNCRARAVLCELRKAGFATSQRWRDGERGVRNVYFLTKK